MFIIHKFEKLACVREVVCGRTYGRVNVRKDI